MKKILLLVLLTLTVSMTSKAQSPDVFRVYELDSTYNKDKIYAKCLYWFGMTFKSAKSVLQIQDKESGKIVGRGTLSASAYGNFYGRVTDGTTCTIDITIKDGKYRIGFSSFSGMYICDKKNGPTEITYAELMSGKIIPCQGKCQRTYKETLISEMDQTMKDLYAFIQSTKTEDF